MAKIDLNHLSAFIVVARERSFTRAAAQLGISQSALSHTIRKLEEGLGVRLLMRSTRGVSPTDAGERMLANIAPLYQGIEAELSAVSELRDKPSGTIRITAHDHAASKVLWPRLATLLPRYPDIKVEVSIDYGLTD
ncbi:MAG TPA: LysR family transcriptional regulator, partial [Massilia timonae]|nr:LysR family transcriptional regulator [Massilia timonae]